MFPDVLQHDNVCTHNSFMYDTLSDLLYIGVAEAEYLHEVVHTIHNIHL